MSSRKDVIATRLRKKFEDNKKGDNVKLYEEIETEMKQQYKQIFGMECENEYIMMFEKKMQIQCYARTYLFWKDRIPSEKESDEYLSAKYRVCKNYIDRLEKLTKTSSIHNDVIAFVTNYTGENYLEPLYTQFKMTRQQHVYKISMADSLFARLKRTFKDKAITLLAPIEYLKNQAKTRQEWERQKKLLRTDHKYMEYMKFMYDNFPSNYGETLFKLINAEHQKVQKETAEKEAKQKEIDDAEAKEKELADKEAKELVDKEAKEKEAVKIEGEFEELSNKIEKEENKEN